LGVINFKNGDKFRGEFMDGRPTGPGTMKYTRSMAGNMGAEFEEATYEGNWVAGKRDGNGMMTWMDNSIFTGLWKNDKRIEGEIKMQNGNSYKGTFKNDLIHGYGRLLISSGTIFEGEFTNGHCSSVGKLLYSNGDCYFG
jgi:1-phosphatidylinositol-4-phosphate 5-kinase